MCTSGKRTIYDDLLCQVYVTSHNKLIGDIFGIKVKFTITGKRDHVNNLLSLSLRVV